MELFVNLSTLVSLKGKILSTLTHQLQLWCDSVPALRVLNDRDLMKIADVLQEVSALCHIMSYCCMVGLLY